MAPKSERFELRIDEETLDRVDAWRAQQTDLPSRAEAVRRLIEVGLHGPSKSNMVLTDGEKLITMMLRDLYQHHKVKGDIDANFVQDVITGGHYWAPLWQMSGLFHGHTDKPENVKFVVDVLGMWDTIKYAHKELSAKDKARIALEAEPFGEQITFPGFDGNNESELMEIARFFVEKLDRFSELKGSPFNSHMPSADLYRRMLAVFKPIQQGMVGGRLTVGQIIAMLKAMKYPV